MPPARETRTEELTKKQLLAGLRAFLRGDFTVRLPDDLGGIDGQLCETFNELVVQAGTMSDEVAQLGVEVGKEGRIKRRLRRGGVRGGWSLYITSVNELIDDLTSHMSEIATVVSAVAHGDLSQGIDIDGADEPLKGAFLRYARIVNDMVKRLADFSSEVTRVAVEVGVEGKLGAQARIKGVEGTWKELTDSVNSMASNLTAQVREIARVTTAVAQGDLTKTINIEVRGEILELKNTINTMVDQLGAFADEVTRVAREVGTEGILGGQAQVRGVSGVWRELHGERELHGQQPHLAGAQHRRGGDGHCPGRPGQEDHGGGEGRDPRAQEHHQHHGGAAGRVRGRGDPRGPRGGHRRRARRSGRGGRRVGRVARAHRERELDGQQPHPAGAQHRRGGHGHRRGRPRPQDHCRRPRRDPHPQEHHQHHGG